MSENDNGNKAKARRPKPKAENKAKAKSTKPKAKPVINPNDAVIENTPTVKELSTVNSNPESYQEPTESMEVHHHPQLEHKPKPWKEYLLECAMIFVAVMLGFIAENIREYVSDNEHVNQLTSQLARDLRADTAQLDRVYRGELLINKRSDSLFHLLQQPTEKMDIKKVQQLIADSHSLWLFHSSNGAIGAIKSELRLKRFSGSKIIAYIANYEGHAELLKTVESITLQYQRNYTDPFLRQHFTPANLDAVFSHAGAPDARMRNLGSDDLTQLAADMVLIRINIGELLKDNRQLKQDATELLQYVEQEYKPESN